MVQQNIKKALLAVFCLLLLTSCTHNPALEARYNAEKMLHEAEGVLKEARAFSSTLPDQKLKELSEQFKSLVDFCYSALASFDSTAYPVEYNQIGFITYQSVIRLSQIYYAHQQYTESVNVTKELLERVSIPRDYLSNVYINLGQALQASGNWDSAYAVFSSTLERFDPPVTNTGTVIAGVFNLPMYMFRTVRYTEDNNRVRRELIKTEQYYQNLIQNYKDTKLDIASRSNLAKLYEETSQWEKELQQLEKLTDPSSQTYHSVLIKQADILGGRLNRHDSALALYDFVFERSEPNDSSTRVSIYFKKSLIHIEKNNFKQARELLDIIKKEYPRSFHAEPLFQYNLARSYELENNWFRAEQEYNLLLEKFKGSSESMMTLLYLVDKFKKNNNKAESERWFKSAEEYFTEVAEDNRGEELEARALLYLSDLYQRSQLYDKSAEILIETYNKFPSTETGRQALFKAIQLNQNELQDLYVADSLLNILKVNLAETVGERKTEDLFEN